LRSPRPLVSAFGAFAFLSSNCVDRGAGAQFDGRFTFDFGGGRTLFGTYVGQTALPLPPPVGAPAATTQTLTIVGGTGAFAGAGGTLAKVGTYTNNADGGFTLRQTITGTVSTCRSRPAYCCSRRDWSGSARPPAVGAGRPPAERRRGAVATATRTRGAARAHGRRVSASTLREAAESAPRAGAGSARVSPVGGDRGKCLPRGAFRTRGRHPALLPATYFDVRLREAGVRRLGSRGVSVSHRWCRHR
jgi:hypothetical protein